MGFSFSPIQLMMEYEAHNSSNKLFFLIGNMTQARNTMVETFFFFFSGCNNEHLPTMQRVLVLLVTFLCQTYAISPLQKN